MNLKLITLLVVIGLIASVGIVCATENVENVNGASGEIADTGISHQDNATNTTGDMYDNGVPYHADGTNATGDLPSNSTAGNATNSTTAAHTLPATGNPILALLAVSALIGVYTIKRK